MSKFKLYAGLSGGFGGAKCLGIYEFDSQIDADKVAYETAWDIYESHVGTGGLLTWDEMYEDCLEAERIEPEAQSCAEVEQIVDECYLQQGEDWIEWYSEKIDD